MYPPKRWGDRGAHRCSSWLVVLNARKGSALLDAVCVCSAVSIISFLQFFAARPSAVNIIGDVHWESCCVSGSRTMTTNNHNHSHNSVLERWQPMWLGKCQCFMPVTNRPLMAHCVCMAGVLSSEGYQQLALNSLMGPANPTALDSGVCCVEPHCLCHFSSYTNLGALRQCACP